MVKLKRAWVLAGCVMAGAASGAAMASHRDHWPNPDAEVAPGYVIVPSHRSGVVGHVTGPSTYYYEPAPRYYYYTEPRYYYYEPAPVAYYYYEDTSAFPRSNSRD